jgi:hypothetical protein
MTRVALQTLKGYLGWVNLVAFSLNGKQVVSRVINKSVA